MTTPINALHRSEISETREDVSVSLGAAYEYEVRVTRDLDEARYWYRKLAYRLVGAPEFYLKFTRQRIAQINPDYRTMSAENWSAALDKGELASGILEEELLAVQQLMNGPVSGIVRASEHLYHGTGGFPRDKEIAKKFSMIPRVMSNRKLSTPSPSLYQSRTSMAKFGRVARLHRSALSQGPICHHV